MGAAPLVLFAVFVAGILLDSGQQSEVVLLPDADGSVGKVEVVTEKGVALLEEAGQMTVVSGASAPSAPVIVSREDIEQKYAQVLAVEPEAPARFLLYFEQGSTNLTSASEGLLTQIVNEVAERNANSLGIYGHSDRTGSDEYNLRLSLQRAEAVRDLLQERGVDVKAIDLDSHGEGNPLIPTADGVAEPRNRRVEVIVR
ncbi:Outer membrane protein OmpA [Malonomonas rubra DSM 5091]|uniref:Outer membrane protein OmpA n=1 Tax=Malonomonas rubra DSM 5091 TaxID=1122189 RepID=A0A1M6FED4_MALRU|nr:OmpA family protein [Malonomonas rubra]SHI96013.1 Outer membrane protein OmpA [Malonomonas rubra DSM 5091]